MLFTEKDKQAILKELQEKSEDDIISRPNLSKRLKPDDPLDYPKGDFNKDGNVDGEDFLLWQSTSGDGKEFLEWQTNYSTTFPVSYASNLAWEESMKMMAKVRLFESTNDRYFLDGIIKDIDHVLSLRDDRLGVRDEIRDKVLPAWSTGRFTGGKRYAWGVHQGMILMPISRVVYLIKRSPVLSLLYHDKYEQYLEEIDEVLDAMHDVLKVEDKSGKFLGYHEPPHSKQAGQKEMLTPFNMQNAMGRVYLNMWLATGDEFYRKMVVNFANIFLGACDDDGKGYLWSYWQHKHVFEDLGHASINMDFMYRCYLAGVVVGKGDMQKFASTINSCMTDKGSYARVDGSGEIAFKKHDYIFAPLAFFEPELFVTLMRHYINNEWSHTDLFGAYLIETCVEPSLETPLIG